ncbi:MAG TPA: FimV/HubP family polar landmark protein [Gammaproteobacteria bacterium]|nr:FimV/HubP family polar landmark protein [Gammaproteobacteria bacterium]
MRRLLALSGLILSLGSLSFGAFALGLGNIQLHSALGQKLDADIALVGVDSPSAAGLQVSLAGPAAFQRAKVERSGILQSLKFVVVNGADGYHVHVTSSQPVREPFLTFIVSARWSSGQVLREYTVLLDPPNYAASSGAAAVQSPAAGTMQAAPAAASTVAAAPAAQPAQMAPATTTSAAGSNYGPIQRGDTLWGIASNLTSGDPAEIDRMMIAIYRNNPHAFAGNINRMRAGYVLEIPDAATVNAISRRDAIAAVKSANQRYLAASPAPANVSSATASSAATPAAKSPTDVTAASPTAPAPAADTQAHLQLVAPSADAVQSAAAPGADSAQLAQLKQQLSAAQQQASDAADRNAKLAGQVNDLKQQLAKTQRMLNVTNKQLAQLQQQARRQNTGKPAKTVGLEGVIAHLTKPLFLAALLVVLVLIVAFIVIRKQRRKAAVAAGKEPVMIIDEPQADEAEADSDLQTEEFAGAAAVPLDDDAAAESAESAADEAQDPIAEADFHVDYGLYDQAAEIILKGIAAEPGRDELKLKLFRIYFAAGDAAGFSSAAQEYASDWGADHPAEWEEVTTMGRQLVPEEPLFAAGFEQTLPGSVDTEMPTELSTELGTDTATELPGEDEEPDEVIADPRDEALDFDFDLGNSTSAADGGEAEPVAEETSGQPAAEAQPEFQNSFDVDTPAAAGASTDFDLSELEAELNPETGDAGYSGSSLTDTQTEFEDAIRELSEFVDTNFPKEPSGDSQPVELPTAGEQDFSPLETLAADDDESEAESFDDDGGLDEMSTKLDLARAYMDMGDPEGARSILEEVIEEGAKQYQDQARELLDKVG